jgi:hypothetical protein
MAEKAMLTQITNNKEEILKISEIAQQILARENKITISNAEAIPSIIHAFLRSTVGFLAENKSQTEDTVIDLFGILEVGTTFRESEDGENDGNFTPFATAGPAFRKGVKDNDITETED